MYYYIVNPAAGAQKIHKIESSLKKILGNFSVAGSFTKTTGSDDIYKLTEIAANQGFNTIVAIGGDGTVKEVALSLINQDAALGIIPIGKSNEIAYLFGIKNWQSTGPTLATRRVAEIPVINPRSKHPMIGTLNLGLLSGVLRNTSIKNKIFEAVNAIFLSVLSPKSARYVKLNIDNQIIEGELDAVRITNGFFKNGEGLYAELWVDLTLFEKFILLLTGDNKKKKILWAKDVSISLPLERTIMIDGEKRPIKSYRINYGDMTKIKVIVGKDRKFI